ncbi:UTRA domain-containing protein [Streptomyces sp. YS415]|uniref:UTRA domain-containing protein n=1 Tax=Streptomyces sp. YS415 TaxID=2944806 RepID=UPI00201FBC5A|nr:UTRA domain-containing protein [Streptomyces sp. YS415]MCL7425330.1 UTRA domain-containing protein [Streptomyces sp. YS415]
MTGPLTEFSFLIHEDKRPHSLARICVPFDLVPATGPCGSPSFDGMVRRLLELRPPLAEVRERVSVRLPTPEEASTLRISSALAVLAIQPIPLDVSSRPRSSSADPKWGSSDGDPSELPRSRCLRTSLSALGCPYAGRCSAPPKPMGVTGASRTALRDG